MYSVYVYRKDKKSIVLKETHTHYLFFKATNIPKIVSIYYDKNVGVLRDKRMYSMLLWKYCMFCTENWKELIFALILMFSFVLLKKKIIFILYKKNIFF